MFWHISEDRSDLWPIILTINRSISFFEDSDSEIAEWLEDHQSIARPLDLGMGWATELLYDRISHHRRIRINITTPSIQQIGFEAQVHYLGLTDLALWALVAILINRKQRMLFLPIPNYIEPGRMRD